MCSAQSHSVAEVSTVANENMQQATCPSTSEYHFYLGVQEEEHLFYSSWDQITAAPTHWFQPTLSQCKNVIWSVYLLWSGDFSRVSPCICPLKTGRLSSKPLKRWTDGFDKIPQWTKFSSFTARDPFSIGSKLWRGEMMLKLELTDKRPRRKLKRRFVFVVNQDMNFAFELNGKEDCNFCCSETKHDSMNVSSLYPLVTTLSVIHTVHQAPRLRLLLPTHMVSFKWLRERETTAHRQTDYQVFRQKKIHLKHLSPICAALQSHWICISKDCGLKHLLLYQLLVSHLFHLRTPLLINCNV